MAEESVVTDRPVLAAAAIFVVAVVVWAVVSAFVRGSISPVETGLFAALFTLVYVGSSYL